MEILNFLGKLMVRKYMNNQYSVFREREVLVVEEWEGQGPIV